MMGEVYKKKYIVYLMSFCLFCGCCLVLAQSGESADQRKSDTEKWSGISKLGTIVITASITTILAFISGILLESRKRRKELKNIRLILLQEMRWNCKELMRLTPFEGDPKKRAPRAVVAEGMSMLSSSVYEKYLDKVCGLKEKEVRSVHDLYIWIQYYAEQGRWDIKRRASNKDAARDRMDTRILFMFCNKLVYRIFRTIEQFEDGTEGLYDMMDNEKKEREEGRSLGDDPGGKYRQWLNKYAHEYHENSEVVVEKMREMSEKLFGNE